MTKQPHSLDVSAFTGLAFSYRASALHLAFSQIWSVARVKRLYHSTSLLLPDGRVLTAGGGRPAAAGEDPLTEHQDAQIFSPPYLFKGTRPVITFAPTAVSYDGQPFFVQTPDALNITAANWIRLSSVTHGFNMNQRISRLRFSVTAGGLNVVAPTDNKLCPPGHYLLFILNGNGVPSIGHILRIGN
ncbi:MAG: galactose oxidase early set domain-containing protein [Acidobacteria bacterium]|nr:galactose oxidase early set domain-containing protein [Acidobacteriota bacterium]MCI0723492.1 galactose oxidase early set domain-containing protein [Acidobacteriota bacterium]